MIYKRIMYALLYSRGEFHLSRNFRLQKVGDVKWLKNNFGFGETCDFIDELVIINVTPNPSESDFNNFFKDINELREKIFLPITIGGGIRTIEHVRKCFENGADKILINFLAHKDQSVCEQIAKIFGKQAISIMVDYKKDENNLSSYINSGKVFSKTLKEFINSMENLKFGELILNSIDQDGTAAGLDLDCLNLIPKKFKNPILVMGGAGKPEHFISALSHERISGVITANLFNFLGKGLQEARNFSIKNNIRLIKFEGVNI